MKDDASECAAARDLLRQGRASEAEQVLRAVLEGNPRHTGALCDLGIALLQQRRTADAAVPFEAALSAAPDHWPALEALGKIYCDTNRPEEALRNLDRLLAIKPSTANTPLHHSWRGQALMQLGRHDEAAAALELAISLRPDLASAWQNLGIVQGLLGQPAKALHCFERLSALQPQNAAVFHFRGMALVELRQYEAAVACFREALRRDPKSIQSLLAMGEPLSTLGRDAEALAAYDAVLKIDPANAKAELGRGDILQILGRIDEAIAAYERAISLAPRWAAAYRHLLQVRDITRDNDPVLTSLEALLVDLPALPDDEAIALHLALSKAYRYLDRYAAAFEHLEKGTQLRRRTLVYDEAVALAEMRRAAETLTEDVMRNLAAAGVSSDLPVFVLGMPRTGTSLVEHILASHSKVAGIGECEAFGRLARVQFGPQLEKLGSGLSREAIRQLGSDYAAYLKAKGAGALRVVDKTLFNFSHAGLIHLALPNARIIHMIRDPMDTCFSCYSQLFMGFATFAFDLGELGRYYKAYTEVMDRGRRVLPAGSMLEIRYEALVEDFESEVRRLIAFCGLEWEDACLRFYETRRAVRTASAVQVRQPLYKDAVGRWKAYAQWLEPLRKELDG